MMDDRARLTPVDVVIYGVAFMLLAIFAPMVYTVMRDNAGFLGTGEAYLFQMVVPALIVTLMFVVYLTAVSGGEQ